VLLHCPSPEKLLAFQQGLLPDQEVDAIADHLEACSKCEGLAQRLDGTSDQLLLALRKPAGANILSTAVRGGEKASGPDLLAEERWPDLPGYQILGPIARGGMGVVYKARQLRLGRLVALKRLPRGNVRAGARAVLEGEVLARLQHPNIVQIHEIVEHNGSIHLALELVQGGSLSAQLLGKPQPPRETAVLIATVARALHHAHSEGIVHRDLKPANILLAGGWSHPDTQTQRRPQESSGERPDSSSPSSSLLGASVPLWHNSSSCIPKIADFGVAKLLTADLGQTQDGDIIGTPSYMAPEQASGKGQEVGPATDVYSLGVILYEMLTGRVPLQGSTTLDTLILVRCEEPVPPRQLQPRIARDLETICLKCLRKEPARRYQSAQQLADDLQHYLDDKPILARPTPVWEQAWKWARRHPGWGALVLLVVAMLPVVTALWFRAVNAQHEASARAVDANIAKEAAQKQRREADAAREEADRLRRQAERREARLALERGHELCRWGALHRGLLWLSRGLELASYTGDKDLERAARINLADWRLRLCEPGQVLRFGSWIHALAISPDGKRALVGAGLQAREWDLASGKPVGGALASFDLRYLEDNLREVRSLAYSPDGEHALVGRSAGSILMWSFKKSSPALRIAHGKDDVWAVAFSPDGRMFLSTGVDEIGPCVRLWDASTGRFLNKAFRHEQVVTDAAFSPDGRLIASASRDGTVRLWQVRTGQQDGKSLRHSDSATTVAFSPDNKLLCTVCRDGEAHLWDMTTHQAVSSPLFGLRRVVSAQFSPDSSYLLTGSWDGQGKLWHVRTRQPVGAALLHDDRLGTIAFSNDKKTFLTGGQDRTVRVWRLPPATTVGPPLLQPESVFAAYFSPDERMLLTACQGQVQMWNISDGRPRGRISESDNSGVTSLAGTPDRRIVAIGTQHPGVAFWDWSDPDRPRRREPSELLRLKKEDGLHQRIVLCSEGKKCLTMTGRTRLEVNLWGLSNARPRLERALAHETPPCCLDVDSTGKMLAVGCRGRTVCLWDLEAGRRLQTLVQPGQVQAVALGQGNLLLVGCRDGAAHLWDVSAGRRLASYQHQSDVLSAAISPNGATALTGCGDGTVRLWDVATGMPLGPVRWHQSAVEVVGFSRQGTMFATGSHDRSAQVWHAPAAPLQGRPEVVKAWVELLAGQELGPSGLERELSPAEKEQRRQILTLPAHAAFTAHLEDKGQGNAGK
jgi:WD40 repeat protein/serine/threonine protein kinase